MVAHACHMSNFPGMLVISSRDERVEDESRKALV